MKCLSEPSGEPKRLLGTSASGACALCVRSGTIIRTVSSVFFTSRPGSPAGPVMTFSLVVSSRKSSAAAMCSITCATDQRSGAGLKFDCPAESPFVASKTFLFVTSRYCSARYFSACVTSCADATTAAQVSRSSATASVPVRDLFLMFRVLLYLASVGETGEQSIAQLRKQPSPFESRSKEHTSELQSRFDL